VSVLVDSNVLIDVAEDDPVWGDWSRAALERAANGSLLVVNALIYAEVSASYARVEEVERFMPASLYRREHLPFEAGFLAGKVFLQYRRRGGQARSPLPDFYIGAHAAVCGHRLLTRDASRFRTYFPRLDIIAPPGD
jgi:predicted nucleic acid-binding protein